MYISLLVNYIEQSTFFLSSALSSHIRQKASLIRKRVRDWLLIATSPRCIGAYILGLGEFSALG
jgi:hypothetical protein